MSILDIGDVNLRWDNFVQGIGLELHRSPRTIINLSPSRRSPNEEVNADSVLTPKRRRKRTIKTFAAGVVSHGCDVVMQSRRQNLYDYYHKDKGEEGEKNRNIAATKIQSVARGVQCRIHFQMWRSIQDRVSTEANADRNMNQVRGHIEGLLQKSCLLDVKAALLRTRMFEAQERARRKEGVDLKRVRILTAWRRDQCQEEVKTREKELEKFLKKTARDIRISSNEKKVAELKEQLGRKKGTNEVLRVQSIVQKVAQQWK